MTDKAVFVIVPLYRPDVASVEFLRNLRSALALPLIIVNDGSKEAYSDIFAQIAAIEDCQILEHKENLGKGRALKTAFEYLINNYPESAGAVLCDGDGQHALNDIVRCYESFTAQCNNVILAVRDFSDSRIPWKSRLGNRISCFLFRTLAHLDLPDTQCGLRALPMDFIKILPEKTGERFEFESVMLLECINRKNPRTFEISQLKIETIYHTEHRTHFRWLSDSWQVIKILLKNRFNGL